MTMEENKNKTSSTPQSVLNDVKHSRSSIPPLIYLTVLLLCSILLIFFSPLSTPFPSILARGIDSIPALAFPDNDRRVKSEGDVSPEFEEWMLLTANKTYGTAEEKMYRYNCWNNNKLLIKEKNRRSVHVKFALNHYGDLTEEEFHSGLARLPEEESSITVMARLTEEESSRTASPSTHTIVEGTHYIVRDIARFFAGIFGGSGYLKDLHVNRPPEILLRKPPKYLDWDEAGAVGPTRTQGSCGSCWAISAVEAVESALFLKTGVGWRICAKQLVFCDTMNRGCKGGWPRLALEYAMSTGLVSSSSPSASCQLENFFSQHWPCKGFSVDADSNSNLQRHKIKSIVYGSPPCRCYRSGRGCDCLDQKEENNIRVAMANLKEFGPGSVCFDAYDMAFYRGGVIGRGLDGIRCSNKFTDMNHCGLLTGYSAEFGEQGEIIGGYWIVQNQWGSSWGENGNVRIDFFQNCGLTSEFLQVLV